MPDAGLPGGSQEMTGAQHIVAEHVLSTVVMSRELEVYQHVHLLVSDHVDDQRACQIDRDGFSAMEGDV